MADTQSARAGPTWRMGRLSLWKILDVQNSPSLASAAHGPALAGTDDVGVGSLERTRPATCLKASSSSSTLPPRPAPMKLTELATYVGSPDFLATSLARRVVNSMVGSTVLSGVDSGWLGLYRWKVFSL